MQRKLRLTKRADFHRVYRHGQSTANRQFVVYVLPQSDGSSFRLGISVSKKVGNAVVRNRLRRIIKEIVRLNPSLIANPLDMVVIVRKPAAEMDYKELEQCLLHVLYKANLLQRRRGAAGEKKFH